MPHGFNKDLTGTREYVKEHVCFWIMHLRYFIDDYSPVPRPGVHPAPYSTVYKGIMGMLPTQKLFQKAVSIIRHRNEQNLYILQCIVTILVLWGIQDGSQNIVFNL